MSSTTEECHRDGGQGAKARLCVHHFREELFATVGAAKHDYDALNMHNVFVAEEGQWRTVVELCLQFIIALWLHQLHLQGSRGDFHGKVKGGGKQLEVRSQRPDSCKREANTSLREATTLTQVSGSTSPGTQAAILGNCSN